MSGPAVPRREGDAIPVFTRVPLVAFTLPWHVRPGKPSRTVIVKGTFDLVPGGPAKLRSEAEPPSGDVHAGDDPQRSVLYPSDFAIWKPRADVTLKGHAHAPAAGPVSASHVRLRFGRGKSAIDRRIAVFGERTWEGSVSKLPSAPRRFESIPLVYEYAFGGPGFPDNPVGLGHQGLTRPPHLEDPARLIQGASDTPAPASLGALPMRWPARWGKLGTYDAAWLKTRWPYFPDDFDWSFFQSAPRSQQLDHLEGDEPFELWGVHKEHPVLGGTLPALAARAFAQKTTAAGGALLELALRLDTVTFDADEMKLSLVWRSVLEVADDDASDIAELFLTAEPLLGPRASLLEIAESYRVAKLRLPPLAEEPPPIANDTGAETAELAPHERRTRERLLAAGVLARPGESSTPASAAPLPAPAPRLAPEQDPVRREVVALLAQGARLDGLDLGGADLSDLDFSSRSLVGANLKDALLRRCRFVGADLSGAQMGGADLMDAALERASLALADLTGANLEGARLDGANLECAVLEGAVGLRASLRETRGARARLGGSVWSHARFDRADLPSADFTAADLDEAVFDGANLPEVRLYEARGTRASFKDAALVEARANGASLPRSSFRGARAPGSIWEGATLEEASFLGAVLTGASFVRAACARATFSGADLREGRLDRARLAGASFLKANLMEASLESCDLAGADLRAANLHGAETWKAELRGADLELAIVTQSKLQERT